MNEHHDLDWLAARAPAAAAPDAATTERARAALVRHATAPRLAPVPVPAAAAAPRAAERRWLRPSRVLALAGVAAAGLLALSALGGGGGQGGAVPGLPAVGDVPAVGIEQASALERLASKVRALPTPAGDATLIVRTHSFPDRQGFTGFDLYADDATYFYGATREELRRAVRRGEPVDADGATRREIAAAAAAAPEGADLDAARALMIAAPFPGGRRPIEPGGDPALAATGKAAAGARRPSQREMDDNLVWIGCMEALMAGFGRTDVRAGVLALLGTMETVRVADGAAVDGRPTLVLDYGSPLDGYHEVLTVDAETSAPVRFAGGVPGETPGVTLSYRVTRVALAGLRG